MGTRGACVLAMTALLASCKTLPPSVPNAPSAQSWEARRAQLQARAQYQLKGRVAVAVGQDGFNARLRWSQSGSQTQLALDGPLGAGGVEVTSNGSEISIVTSQGERLDAAAARAELVNRLGFDPPLASLRYWIQGVPDPETPGQESLNAQQRLATLDQSGWRMEYTAYEPAGDDVLPAKLTLNREGVRVRVVVDGWSQ